MKKYILGAALSVFLLIFSSTSVALAQDMAGFGGFGKEQAGLYGYILNYINMTEDNIGNRLYLRLKGDWDPGANLSFHMELFTDYRRGNQDSAYLKSLYPYPSTEETASDVSDDLTLKIDHLWGLVNLGKMDIQFGKIPIGWGTGYAFNPTAKTHPVSFLNDNSEETPGTLGILVGYALNDSTALQGYVAFEDKTRTHTPENGEWERIPFGVKAQRIWGAFDLSIGWIREVVYLQEVYDEEYYLCGDFVGAVCDFGVYGEVALNLPRNGGEKFNFSGHRTKDLLEYCLGGDYIFFDSDVTIRMEYYHQGRGVSKKTDYNFLQGLSVGQELQAEDYLLLSLEKLFHDYYIFTIGSLVNLNDASLVLMPELTYDAAENLELLLGFVALYGEDGSEFNGKWNLGGKDIQVLQPAIYLSAKLSF